MANKSKKYQKKTTHKSKVHEAEAATETSVDIETHAEHHHKNTHIEETPIRVDFPYSELVRSYVPDAMAVADKALADWKHEGSFMNLGINNPYANMAVSISLQNAKKIEKKLEEKGVLPVVRMGIEVLKNKIKKA